MKIARTRSQIVRFGPREIAQRKCFAPQSVYVGKDIQWRHELRADIVQLHDFSSTSVRDSNSGYCDTDAIVR